MNNFNENLQKISNILRKLGKKDNIKIIAVTKSFKQDIVLNALKSGFFCFGENKVQECKAKYSKIIKNFSNIELHMIGHLQTNKVRDALDLFNTIHTLDRERLALEIKKKLTKTSLTKNFFIQVNIGKETQKSGVSLSESNSFIKWCINDLKLNVIGLMCIPPENINPKHYFLELKKISDNNSLRYLSMGMSNDYVEAIECGATHIRLGTALFGERKNY